LLFYLLIYIFLVGLSFLDYVKISTIDRFLFTYLGGGAVFLIFWALGSLRWETGTDWTSYFDSFTYFSDVYRVLFEPGYGFFLSIIRGMTGSFTVYLIILTFLCLAFKFAFFYKYHKETLFTVLLLFFCYYFADIFAVRQKLANSLTLFSTIFIINRKPVIFALIVAVATSIHITSILYFFAYYVYWANVKDRYFIVILLVSMCFGILSGGEKLLNLVLQVIGASGRVGDKIKGYLSGDSNSPGGNPLIAYLLGLTKRCIFIPVFMLIKNRLRDTEPKIQGYFNLYILGNVIYFLFAKDLAVFARASVSYLFFEIFLFAYAINYFRNSKKTLVLVFTISVLIMLSRFNALINTYYDLYVPYYSIFDNHIDRVLR